MLPGQACLKITATGPVLGFHATFVQSLQPGRKAEPFNPTAENTAFAVGFFHHISKTAIPARKNAFQVAHGGLMPAQTDVLVPAHRVAQIKNALFHGVHGNLGFPLERRMRFGYEGRHRRGYGQTRAVPPALFILPAAAIAHLDTQIHNGVQIVPCFRGQTEHEIEFNLLPAVSGQLTHMVDKRFFRDALVDDIAQALTARFRCKRRARAADARHARHDFTIHRSHPQGRQGYGDLFPCTAIRHIEEQGLEAGKIPTGKRQKGYVVIAGAGQAFLGQLPDFLNGTFPRGAQRHACLAKTASSGAAACDFQRKPVVHSPKRRDLTRGIKSILHIRHGAAQYRCVIGKKRYKGTVCARRKKRGHINPGNMPGPAQEFRAGQSICARPDQQFHKLRHNRFALAQHHQIHKGGERFSAKSAAASGHDQRPTMQIFTAICRSQRNTGQIQHEQNIGESQFMGDTEPDKMGIGKIGVAFQRGQRNLALNQHLRRVTAGGKNPLGQHAVHGVEQTVQNFLPEVRHGHFVQIGKSQSTMQTGRSGISLDRPLLDTKVTAGTRQKRQNFLHDALSSPGTRHATTGFRFF